MELVSFDIILNQTKMKNIKDIVIGIFAVVGFAAIVTGFTNEAGQEPTFGTPESHVWEFAPAPLGTDADANRMILFNKKTGDLRRYSYAGMGKKLKVEYIVAKEKPVVE